MKYEKFTIGNSVIVEQCYLNDEINKGNKLSSVAIVFSEPNDDEELVGIQYNNGTIDYVPQYILEIDFNIKFKFRKKEIIY